MLLQFEFIAAPEFGYTSTAFAVELTKVIVAPDAVGNITPCPELAVPITLIALVISVAVD